MTLDETVMEVQKMIDCGGISLPVPPPPAPPRPLVNRCACGCGQRISNNRLMTRDCWNAAQAAKDFQEAK